MFALVECARFTLLSVHYMFYTVKNAYFECMEGAQRP